MKSGFDKYDVDPDEFDHNLNNIRMSKIDQVYLIPIKKSMILIF